MLNDQILEYSYSLFESKLYEKIYIPFLMDRRFSYHNVFQFNSIKELNLAYNNNNLTTEAHENVIGDFFFLRYISSKTPYFLPARSSSGLYRKRSYSYTCTVRFTLEDGLRFFIHYLAFAANRVSYTDFGLYPNLMSQTGVTFFLKNYPQFRVVATHPVFLDWKSTLNIKIKWQRNLSFLEAADFFYFLKCRSRCLMLLSPKSKLYL